MRDIIFAAANGTLFAYDGRSSRQFRIVRVEADIIITEDLYSIHRWPYLFDMRSGLACGFPNLRAVGVTEPVPSVLPHLYGSGL